MGEKVKQNQVGEPGDPDEATPAGAAAGTQPDEMDGSANNDAQNNPSADEGQAELERLRAALSKANGEAASSRHELKKIQDAQRQAELADMDELDRLKTEVSDLSGAAEARDVLQTQVEELETAVNAQVEALEKQLKIPGHVTKLMESMSPAAKLAYLAENQKHFQPPIKPNIDSQNSGGTPPKKPELDAERKKKLRSRFRLG